MLYFCKSGLILTLLFFLNRHLIMQYKTGTRRVFCWEIHHKGACFLQGPKPKWKIGHSLHPEELVAWTLSLPRCSPLGWSLDFKKKKKKRLIFFHIWMPDAQFAGLPASGTHEKGSKWMGFFSSRWHKTMCNFLPNSLRQMERETVILQENDKSDSAFIWLTCYVWP